VLSLVRWLVAGLARMDHGRYSLGRAYLLMLTASDLNSLDVIVTSYVLLRAVVIYVQNFVSKFRALLLASSCNSN
jgi:hypothetical protein